MKPRVIAYIPLMYGKEYLRECILSMEPLVERIIIFYVSEPSQGFGTSVTCPETEEELKQIAFATSDKVEWINQHFNTEGEHRAEIYKYAQGYDLVLSLDADEVADTEELSKALDIAMQGDKRYYGIGGFINFWRSFEWACYDGFTPIRITNLHNQEGIGVVPCKIYHFSCAQREEIIRYKWEISGHKDELRPNWIEDILYKWSPNFPFNDLHPVALGLWNATPYEKETLPQLLKQHTNYSKELI